MFKLKSSALVLSLSVAALLSACGGGGGGAAPSLSGVAAVGDPIIGGEVTANCSDGNPYLANPTSRSGAWSIATVPAAAFPCVVQVSYGAPESTLNSYAAGPGVVNITPFTDLILAMAAKGNPTSYFSNVSEENKADLADEINAAINKLKAALAAKGYLLASDSFDPISARFTASAGNFYDDLLEAFKKGLSDDGGKTYSDLLAIVIEDPNADLVLPDAPPKETGGTTTPDETAPATIHSKLVGTYKLKFKQGGGEGCGTTCSFVEDQDVNVIVGADNTLTIDGKKFTNPVNRVLFAGGTPHLPEIIWIDGNLDYALSNNEDTPSFPAKFNEINLIKREAGVITFLGQLSAPVVKDDPVAKLKPLAGSYAPEFVLKSGNYNLPSQGTIQKPPVNTKFTAVINESGVVVLDGLTFDPEDSSYQFVNFPTIPGQLPSYNISYRQDEKTRISLDIFLDDEEIVAWKVSRETDNGGGSFGISSVLLEERPYPADQQILFDNLVTASKSGSELGVQLVALANGLGYMKCDQLALEVVKESNSPLPGQLYRYMVRNLTSTDRSLPAGNIDAYIKSKPFKVGAFTSEVFDRRYIRYSSESMTEALQLQRGSIVKRSDGFINYEPLSSGPLSGVATNNPAEISSVGCPAIKPLPEDEPV
jgi:hypothetical protein